MGSVKDLVVLKVPTPTEMGIGRFDFSDRYSVFDWGEMPDHVPYKGASLCAMSAYFFERLDRNGAATHYVGLEDAANPVNLDSVSYPPTRMIIRLARPVKPAFVSKEKGYDYASYAEAQKKGEGNFVVPVEVIYRNTLPRGSSVFRRLKNGSLTLDEMGLNSQPQEGDVLPRVFVDGSTKYEEFDRYPGWVELQRLAGLTDHEMDGIKWYVRYGNNFITESVGHAGLQNDDGKFEFVFDPDRQLMFADTMGALDECRFTYGLDDQRIDVSKEIPRQWYRKRQPEWVAQIDEAKKSGRKNWKSLVDAQPEPLPPTLLGILSSVYASAANAVTGRNMFNAPELPDVVKEYQKFIELEVK